MHEHGVRAGNTSNSQWSHTLLHHAPRKRAHINGWSKQESRQAYIQQALCPYGVPFKMWKAHEDVLLAGFGSGYRFLSALGS